MYVIELINKPGIKIIIININKPGKKHLCVHCTKITFSWSPG